MHTKNTRTARADRGSIVVGLLAAGLAALMALLVLVAPADAAKVKKAPEDAPVLNIGHRGPRATHRSTPSRRTIWR